MLTSGRRDLVDIGRYRTHEDPMQIVSGARMDKKNVHYEAPPSNSMAHEMKAFIDWFNTHSKGVKSTNSLLAKSGIAHFYFLAVHPKDETGRIARAISEKSLSISLGSPALSSLSQMIQSNKKAYYESLASII